MKLPRPTHPWPPGVETGLWPGYPGTGAEGPGNREAFGLRVPRHFATLLSKYQSLGAIP